MENGFSQNGALKAFALIISNAVTHYVQHVISTGRLFENLPNSYEGVNSNIVNVENTISYLLDSTKPTAAV